MKTNQHLGNNVTMITRSAAAAKSISVKTTLIITERLAYQLSWLTYS